MAKASYVGANVVISTDTFNSWLTMTNRLIYDMSTVVMTTEANSAGATTTGNAVINGVFAATTMVGMTALRGGNVTTSGNLTVTSNLIISGAYFGSAANSYFSNSVFVSGVFTANGGAAIGPNVTISNALTANQMSVTGTKNFGAANTLVFTEFASNTNNGKFLRQANNLLTLATIALSDLSDTNVGSAVTDQYLKYDGSKWVPSAITSGGSFSSNTISANNLSAVYNAQLGALSVMGGSGYALNVSVNSTVSVADFTATNVSFANAGTVQLGPLADLRITGGANNQFIQMGNSTNGNVIWATVDKDFIFPDATITTIGANILSVDRSNGRVGFGTNAVPSSYVVGILGNLHANGDILSTGNVSVAGNVSASTFVGALSGLATNALALNGKADTYFANATNITTGTLGAARLPYSMDQAVATTSNVTFNVATASAFMPAANGAAFGNTTKRSEVFGNTGNFSGGLTVTAASDFGNTSVTGLRIRNYKEYVESVGTISTNAQAINLANSNIFDMTLANNSINVTFSNAPSSGNAYSFTMIVRQDVTGNRVLTWPSTVKWAGGTAPTLSNTGSAIDMLSFMTVDGGASYFGAMALGNLS